MRGSEAEAASAGGAGVWACAVVMQPAAAAASATGRSAKNEKECGAIVSSEMRWQVGEHGAAGRRPGRVMHASLREDYLSQVRRDFLSRTTRIARTRAGQHPQRMLYGPGRAAAAIMGERR